MSPPDAGEPRSRWWTVVDAILWVGYPVLVFVGLEQFGARELGLLLIGTVLVLALLRRGSVHTLRLPLAIVALLLVGVVLDDPRWMLAQPVLVNAVLLMSFAVTLRPGHGDQAPRHSMVERFARLKDPDLDAEKVAWCRTWTVLWCLFFALNGATAAALAIFAPLRWWTFYTGLVGYLLVGAMLGIERVLRRLRFGV